MIRKSSFRYRYQSWVGRVQLARAQRHRVWGIIFGLLWARRFRDAFIIFWCSAQWTSWRVQRSKHIQEHGCFRPGDRVLHAQPVHGHGDRKWAAEVVTVSYNSRMPMAKLLVDCDKFEVNAQVATLTPEAA